MMSHERLSVRQRRLARLRVVCGVIAPSLIRLLLVRCVRGATGRRGSTNWDRHGASHRTGGDDTNASNTRGGEGGMGSILQVGIDGALIRNAIGGEQL